MTYQLTKAEWLAIRPFLQNAIDDQLSYAEEHPDDFGADLPEMLDMIQETNGVVAAIDAVLDGEQTENFGPAPTIEASHATDNP